MYELVSPVDFRLVLKYLGLLLLGMGAVLFVPFSIAVLLSELFIASVYGVMGVFVLGLGYTLHRFIPEGEIQWKEAMVISALVFPVAALISSIPFSLSTGMGFPDAYFEAVSGITTTGLSVAPSDAGLVFLFARSWLQWIGGIGILIIVISLLGMPGISVSRLFGSAIGDRKIRPTVIGTAAVLFEVYLLITIVSFLLLLAGGMAPFDAICHAFTTVSTGGFSTRPESVAAFSGFFIPAIITIGCVLGAVNFEIYSRMVKNPAFIFRSLQFRWFVIFALLGVGLLAFTMLDRGPLQFILPEAAFQAFSAITTAGFSTADLGAYPDSAKAVMCALMWIGGSMGSTAGGIKILRIIVLFSIVYIIFIRFFLPREVITTLKVGDTVIEPQQVLHLVTFVLLYGIVLIASSFIFMVHGYSLVDSLFETSSALGTVGLSIGITGPALPLQLKLVLIIDMLLGRIEIIPLALLIFPRTWVKASRGGKNKKPKKMTGESNGRGND
ncbi:MAG TPA: TrkH family potassium uptake protein [Methanoregulaceae archaeon]|nr:TrkH family potassium uptake protein [Methanoregulaceae archaeon]